MSYVRSGHLVKIHYVAKTSEGGVFETSQSRDPLQFVAGSDDVIAGISEAVLGMRVGEKKTIRLAPDQAFGRRDAGLQQRVSRSHLPDSVREGDQLLAEFEGQQIDVWVHSLTDEDALIDSNHPLAGETLIYEIELVSV